MKIVKAKEGLAVLLPQPVVDALSLKPGDEVEAEVRRAPGASDETAGRSSALARLSRYRGVLPAAFRFEREAAQRGGDEA